MGPCMQDCCFDTEHKARTVLLCTCSFMHPYILVLVSLEKVALFFQSRAEATVVYRWLFVTCSRLSIFKTEGLDIDLEKRERKKGDADSNLWQCEVWRKYVTVWSMAQVCDSERYGTNMWQWEVWHKYVAVWDMAQVSDSVRYGISLSQCDAWRHHNRHKVL